MTSIAATAHTAAPPPMSAAAIAFYATAATVIPILFLAFAVQGRSYDNMLSAASRVPNWGRAAVVIRQLAASVLLIYTAIAILVSGAVGEAFALWVLYEGHNIANIGLIVLLVTFLLIAAVTAGPMLTFLQLWTANVETQPLAIPEPEAAPRVEPDKPDPA